jgi:aminoglycoside 6-adenylyltransferase
MRSEEEIFQEIMSFARVDERVRAVMLNGSRVKSNAPVDIMQDYDIIFFITDIENESYKRNQEWIKRFGDIVIFQQNEFEDGYIFLMQFKDGVRIDLRFADVKEIEQLLTEDSLSKILLDKDGLVEDPPVADDSIYFVKKPTEKEFDKLLNESWWIQTYIAKGVWRDELPYVKFMFDVILMDCIRKLLSWWIGLEYGWQVNVGKCGKWFKSFLPEELYNEFIDLYPSTDYQEIWQSLFRTGEFIYRIGLKLADELGYNYSWQDDINVTEYIKQIKELPADAEDF